MDAIELPTENFMARAENLSDEGREIGLQTDEEIVRFVANNTFVDGESLNEIYPQVEEFLTAYRAEAGKLDQVLDFNLFRKTPKKIKLTMLKIIAMRESLIRLSRQRPFSVASASACGPQTFSV